MLNAAESAVKISVGLITNSVSILSDGLNNLSDFVGNVAGLAGIALSQKAPDEKYPHGYGRIETLVNFLISTILLAVAALFVYNSVERLFFYPPINFNWLYFGLIAGALAVKIGMSAYYTVVYRRTKNDIVRTQMLDGFVDVGVAATTLLSLGLSATVNVPLDAVLGIAIGVAVFVAVIKNFFRTGAALVGREGFSQETPTADDYAAYLNESGVETLHVDAYRFGNSVELFAETTSTDEDAMSAAAEKLAKQNVRVTYIKK